MIPISRLYVITGSAMVVLLISMVLDALIPIVSNVWIDAIAHPFVAVSGIMLITVLLYERSVKEATFSIFLVATIMLLTTLINEALVSMVVTGTIPVTLSMLASLSMRMRLGWYILGVSAAASIISGAVLASSVLVAIIIGAGLTILLKRWNDA